jgi:superfamily I DNA/RNA helicase
MVVDEFQDLSPVQLAVVEQLWAARKAIADAELRISKEQHQVAVDSETVADNTDRADSTMATSSILQYSLLVVGDDEQAIFQWRLGMHH